MHQLRAYQTEALDAAFAHWRTGGVNPLVDLATGTGKSLVIADAIRRAISLAPHVRVLMLVHNKELVAQNAKEVLQLMPGLDLGILCGNLGRYDTRSKVLFASVQSAAKRLDEIGERTFVLIDEAHRVPRDAQGQYGACITHLQQRNPKTKVMGLTASPYRLDSGRLDQGEGRLFDKVVYTYSISDGVADGYLAPLISKATALKLNTAGVGRSGGEFKAGELQAAVDQHELTAAAVAEAWQWRERTNRRRAIAFCAGVEHAGHVADAMCVAGWRARAVTGEMDQADRDRAIADFKAGRLDALTSVDILTTGFNVPEVDLVMMLRPTLSTGLYVQMLGRGTRPVYPLLFNQHTATLEERVAAIAASSKPDCLVLDYAGNVRRHGPVDAVSVRTEKGKASVKDHEPDEGKACPNCSTMVARNVKACPTCEHVWPGREANHDGSADETSAVMSGEAGAQAYKEVQRVTFFRQEKLGKIPNLRVKYSFTDGTDVAEWICLEHPRGGMAGSKAVRWWVNVMREEPVPSEASEDTVNRCYSRSRECAVTHVRHAQVNGFPTITHRLVSDGVGAWLVVENCTPRPISGEEKAMALEAFGPPREKAKAFTDDGFESLFVTGLLAVQQETRASSRPFAPTADDDEIPY